MRHAAITMPLRVLRAAYGLAALLLGAGGLLQTMTNDTSRTPGLAAWVWLAGGLVYLALLAAPFVGLRHVINWIERAPASPPLLPREWRL